MASNVRRAAGTQTFVDVLKVWSGNKRPSPAKDLEDFAAGMTLEVSCFSRPLGETARSHLGTLSLTRGEPVTWRRRRQDPVTLRGPLTLKDSAERPKAPQLTAFDLVTASGSLSVQIPTLDVELVEHAFAVQA